MWIALLIMLREGIEAALIVGIVASFLRQSGYGHLMKNVWLGVGLAVILCALVGYGIHRATGEIPQKQQEFLVGAIGLVAVAMLTYMILWMKSAAKSMKSMLQNSVQAALNRGNGRGWALVAMAFLAVLREGLESVFFLIAVFEQSPDASMPLGAVMGLALAAAVGLAIYQGGIRLNLAKFFRLTGVFLIFVAAGLFAGAFRAWHEAGIWNIGQTVLADWSHILHEQSPFGVLLAGFLGYTDHPVVSDVVLYLAYLVPVLYLFLRHQNSSK
ncbi:FTR1 family protein [Simonsiella muelleri]|uniref:FTR1 family protein n=1 Tax=Simonsiella muelleri ATCC 29453 TaxID=641147 RepID=V9HE45_9NEIS|nr:iron uptake transporter permease EfeU [Simonsiella muelleri]AUX60485.1 iron transporter [Simonsiella muelleri ATCC 29453]EFG31986.2 FTR1 family protein [Simonsiella muelleri ATCC 29453]UBQ54692.1 FTR1 family protein [Simonsiella muelleri]